MFFPYKLQKFPESTDEDAFSRKNTEGWQHCSWFMIIFMSNGPVIVYADYVIKNVHVFTWKLLDLYKSRQGNTTNERLFFHGKLKKSCTCSEYIPAVNNNYVHTLLIEYTADF